MKPPTIKFLILRILEEGPKTGYEIMKQIKELLGSSSPGSIYPLLRWWMERGYVGKENKYYLTEKGRKLLSELEKRRMRYLEEAKKDLLALSKALNDPEMEQLVSFIPFREKVGEKAVLLLARLAELLTTCKRKEKLIIDLENFLAKWEELC